MNLTKWMNDTVKYKKYKGQSGNGKKVYDDTEIKARVELKKEIVTNSAGELTVGKGSIYTLSELLNGDIFVYNNVEYEIVSVGQIKRKDGKVNHYEGVFK